MNANLITSGDDTAVSTVLESIIRAFRQPVVFKYVHRCMICGIDRYSLWCGGWCTKLRVLQCKVFVYRRYDKYVLVLSE